MIEPTELGGTKVADISVTGKKKVCKIVQLVQFELSSF